MCPFHKTSQCMKSPQGCVTAKNLREHVVKKHLKIKGDEEEAKAWFKRIGYRIQQNGQPKQYTKSDREDLVAKGFQFNEAGIYT